MLRWDWVCWPPLTVKKQTMQKVFPLDRGVGGCVTMFVIPFSRINDKSNEGHWPDCTKNVRQNWWHLLLRDAMRFFPPYNMSMKWTIWAWAKALFFLVLVNKTLHWSDEFVIRCKKLYIFDRNVMQGKTWNLWEVCWGMTPKKQARRLSRIYRVDAIVIAYKER